eukprot:6743421-Prorocentrum_lima.AAC.1
MTSSLVGSEMCIRDRVISRRVAVVFFLACYEGADLGRGVACAESVAISVSYTHLTLPTICSV